MRPTPERATQIQQELLQQYPTSNVRVRFVRPFGRSGFYEALVFHRRVVFDETIDMGALLNWVGEAAEAQRDSIVSYESS